MARRDEPELKGGTKLRSGGGVRHRAWEAATGRWGFVKRHGLLSEEEWRRVREVLDEVERDGLSVVRVAFVDQHGLTRCKVVPAAKLGSVFEGGIAVPSSILAKDTSDRTVFPVFKRQGVLGFTEMRGASDVVIVPDPGTFRKLPWSPGSGWILGDLYFPSGGEVPFSTRGLYRRMLGRLAENGYEYRAGIEVEFHIFHVEDRRLAVADVGWPPPPPAVGIVVHGYRLLSEVRWDEVEPRLEELRRALEHLRLPLRSIELEFGPSQVEITLDPLAGMEAADSMVLLRSAVKQVLRRSGLHATFMARPLPNLFSSGWHLHQSLLDLRTGENAFMGLGEEPLSPAGRAFLGGLLAHARAASVFACPTVNGYRRYRPFSLAPDRVCWGVDNKGAMLRVITAGPGDPATHIENRAGEPAANPYLYMSAQLVAGMDGLSRNLDPGPPAEEPYDIDAPALPRSLDEAVEELDRSEVFRDQLGSLFIDYFLTLKRAELDRFRSEVTEWEQREYLEVF